MSIALGKLTIAFALPLILGVCVLSLELSAFTAVLLTSLSTITSCLWFFKQKRREFQLKVAQIQTFTQNLIDIIPEPIHIKDTQGRCLMVNQAFIDDQGITYEDIFNQIDPTSSMNTRASLEDEDEAVLKGKILLDERKSQNRHGEECYQLVIKGSCFDAKGDRVIVCINVDITRWRTAEHELARALAHEHDLLRQTLETEDYLKKSLERETHLLSRTQAFIQQLIDLIPDPVYLKDSGRRFIMVNDAFAKETTCSKQEMIGKTASDFFVDPEIARTIEDEDKAVMEGEEVSNEQHVVLPVTGEECYRIVFKRRCIDVEGNPIIFGLHHSITRWKIAELELQALAQKDPLTGIANRRYFVSRAEKEIISVLRNGAPLSLAIYDLDNFKRVNDKYGHPVGDEVLTELVRRSLLCIRRSDFVGRWGGEEFIMLLPATALEGAHLVAENLRSAIANIPFQTSAGHLSIQISCGVAQYQAGEGLDQLIGRADEALYSAKHEGRNRVKSNTPESKVIRRTPKSTGEKTQGTGQKTQDVGEKTQGLGQP